MFSQFFASGEILKQQNYQFKQKYFQSFALRSGSRSYSEWKKPTAPIFLDIYLFNWTNPEDIRNQSSKPIFNQIGPYRFREFRDKMSITFNENNATVSYRKFSNFYFDSDHSFGSLSDICTTVNMVVIGAGKKIQYANFINQKVTSIALSGYNQKLHVTKTVRELLFEGYEDDLVTLSKIFSDDSPFDRVGFMIGKNGSNTPSGFYNVATGIDDIKNLGKIKSHNYMSEFPFYEGECRKMKGSAGEFFPPENSIQQSIYLFVPELCRSIPYNYEKDVEVEGVLGNRFLAETKSFENCLETDKFMPKGLLNTTLCSYEFPMFMSFPHFYDADLSYIDAVEGLKPDKKFHENFITLEPVS
jgi:scavenger receptor class B, member 1